MRVLITYSSKTGNTKKVAEAIQKECMEATLLDISDKEGVEQTDFKAYDVLFIGGWIDKGTFNKECLAFAKEITNQSIGFFFTLGAYPSGKHAYDCITRIKQLFEEQENQVLGHFHCQGAVDTKLVEWMKTLPQEHGHGMDRHRQIRWENAAKHPNQEDFDAAASFADLTLKNYNRLKGAN